MLEYEKTCIKTLPKIIPKVERDDSDLEKISKRYVISITGDNYFSDDHCFFEKVIEYIYGKNIWEWINKHDK
jgi:hypothetical protein